MPRAKTTWEDVQRVGLALPDVVPGSTYGAPALKVGGNMFACIASHKSAEPDTLVVRIPVDKRNDLIAEQPDVYYVKDHYLEYPCVLVRLGRIRTEALRDLLVMGHRFIVGAGRATRPRRTRSKRPGLRRTN